MNLKYALKHGLDFNEKEATTIIIISALSGFILSFRRWGVEEFDATEGISNLIKFSIMFLILFFLFIYTQKVTAITMGLDARMHLWKYGPPLGVLVTIMSYGVIPFVFLGGVKLTEIPRLRLGKFRRTAINIKEMLIIGLVGPMVLLFLSLLVFFPLYLASESSTFMNLIWITSIILVVSALPLPSLNGLNLLLKYRSAWVIYFLYTLILYGLLQILMNPLMYALALILALIGAFIIKKIMDKKF